MRADELLGRSAARFPAKIAVVCGAERCSYEQLERRAAAFASRLLDAGIERGDRVAVCLENSIDAVVAIFGILKAGAVFFVVNPHTRPERLASLLADSAAVMSEAIKLVLATTLPSCSQRSAPTATRTSEFCSLSFAKTQRPVSRS